MSASVQPNQSKSWTPLELLRWATEDFSRVGLVDARLSAEVLLAQALATDRIGLYLHFDRPVSDSERDTFRGFVLARRKRKPVAYLVGEKEFYSLPFFVDESVLIPRPETEVLVDECLTCLDNLEKSRVRIVDVGTGSGAIAVSLLKMRPNLRAVGIDRSRPALEVARRNAERNEVQLDLVQTNLLDGLGTGFDVVVANLPYVATSHLSGLEPDVREFEPIHALDGGQDGLEHVHALISSLAGKNFNGHLLLEFGVGQEGPIRKHLQAAGFSVRRTRTDYSSIPRVIWSHRVAG